MRGTVLVGRRELVILLRSPAVFFLAGAFHLWNALAYRRLVADSIAASTGAGAGLGLSDAVVAPLFVSLLFALTLFVPLLTMRSLSDDRRTGFEDLLASLPLSSAQVVGGKFAAILAATLALTLPPAMLVVCLAGPAAPEWGVVAAASLGLVLAGGAFAALGIWISSFVASPALAAATGTTGLLVLFFLDRIWGGGAFFSARLAYEPFARGVLSLAQAVRWIGLAALCLFLATQTLELRKRTR